jgi:CheY-like chemotaxis protein
VLHVDDDAELLDLTSVTLGQEWPQVTLRHYDDPDEALAALETTTVDCVVSDSIHLADGTPFARGVRDLDASTPIVLFTGSAWDEVREVAEAVDATGYVHKGTSESLAELGRQVHAVVSQTDSVERPHTLENGWTVVGRHDWSADVELSSRLVELVTAHTGVDAAVAAPLFETVDTDAVTTLLAPVGGGNRDRDRSLEVRFQWLDYELRVTGDGVVALRPFAEREPVTDGW